MNHYRAMAIFVQVVESGSFAGAAKKLGVTKSAVSQHISMLEGDLGIRLLQRTTRRLSLTEAGDLYLDGCRQMVEAAEIANQKIGQYRKEPSGTLRISCSQDFAANNLVPLLTPFLERYQKLSLDIDGSDQVIDLVKEQIDLAIRIGHLPESGVVARKISNLSEMLVTAPCYLQRFGAPREPADLTKHQWIALTQMTQPYQVSLQGEQGQRQVIRLYGRARSNSASTVQQMAVNGMGIARLLEVMVRQDLKLGRLVQVLPNYRMEPVGLYAVYPQQTYVPFKVRAVIDYLVEMRNAFSKSGDGE